MIDSHSRMSVPVLITLLASAMSASAQLDRPCWADDTTRVIAKLGEQAITDRDVDFQLGRVLSESLEPPAELPPAVLQSTIFLIAQQRQALQTLRSRQQSVGREDVERWLIEHGQPKSGEVLTASAILRQQAEQGSISESNLRDHLAFRLSWQRYLQQQLTEKNVAKHFENQTQRFDGTRFHLSIVAIAAAAGKSNQRDRVTEFLTELRGRLQAGDLQWDGLATELSKSALFDARPGQFRVQEQLWARGTGDLEPTIITAVMRLKAAEISLPIQTATGVQLVHLHALKEGKKELSEVRDEVRAHMLVHLLEQLARPSELQLTLAAAE